MELTQQQLENVQIDYGIIFANYGETDQRRLGPTRGGGECTVTANIRNIEFDGSKGKTKGTQVIDAIDAMLKVTSMSTSMEDLHLSMPYATLSEDKKKITFGTNTLGIIKSESYLKNITMFAKVIGGGYKKITLKNAMSENPFTLAAAPKGEGTIALEVYAHWDAMDDAEDLCIIEDVASIIPIEE